MSDGPMTEQQRVWEAWAQVDPYWAILSDPGRKGGKWDLDEFFSSGVKEIGLLLGQLEERHIDVTRGRCLDFGCGAGRLSQALAGEFEHVDGVDISETMIELARASNRHGDRCTFHVNTEPDLGLFDDGTFDFAFTMIVLQHNTPDVAEGYIRELVRILAPGGVAVFDMPSQLREAPSLPPGSHKAQIEIVSGPRRMQPGETAIVVARVTNTSSVDWPANTRLALGNHWMSDGGDLLVLDDGRSRVMDAVAAGDALLVELEVTAPQRPGDHRLALDLVEELICWFGDRGSETAELPVRVRGSRFTRGARTGAASGDGEEPVLFGMYGLSRERVLAAVAESGGEVLEAAVHDIGDVEWDAFRYFVVKP
jgi:SAM-dependent methyltransferase